jgi:hypothetical protein
MGRIPLFGGVLSIWEEIFQEMPPTKKHCCGEPGCIYSSENPHYLSIHLGKTGHAAPAEEQKAVKHRPVNLMESQEASISAASTSGTSDIKMEENEASLLEAEQPAQPANFMGGETNPASSIPEPEAGIQPAKDTSLIGGESSPKDPSQGTISREVVLNPLPACGEASCELLEHQPEDGEASEAARYADPLPSLGLSPKEKELSEILLELTAGKRDQLLKLLPSLAGDISWKNSKEFQDHLDERDLLVCAALQITCMNFTATRK